MAHGVTPEALAPALDARRRSARAAFIVSPTYYGMAADVAGCAEVAHERGVPLVVDQAWGPHFGFHPALPAVRARARRRRRCSPRPTRSSAGSPSRRCCTSPATAAGSTPTRSRARAAGALDQPESRCCWPRWTRRGASSRVHGEALLHRRSRRRRARARRSATIAGVDGRRRGVRRAPRRRRLGPAADRDRRARHRLHRLRAGRRAARAPTTSTSSWRPTRRSCWSSASASRSDALERFAHDFARDGRRIGAAGRGAARWCARSGGARQRDRRSRRARPSSARRGGAGRRGGRPRSPASRSPATRRASPRCCRASASPRRSSPTCASCSAAGARLHGAGDPAFATIYVLVES